MRPGLEGIGNVLATLGNTSARLLVGGVVWFNDDHEQHAAAQHLVCFMACQHLCCCNSCQHCRLPLSQLSVLIAGAAAAALQVFGGSRFTLKKAQAQVRWWSVTSGDDNRDDNHVRDHQVPEMKA